MNIVIFSLGSEIVTLGSLHVVTYLESKGRPVHHVYLPKEAGETDTDLAGITRFLGNVKPDLIGVSLMTMNYSRGQRLTECVKRAFPGVPVIWGGIHPTFAPEESMRHADFVCVGEGEEGMLDLVRACEEGDLERDIPNVWRRSGDRILRTEVRPLIQDLDSLPFPRIRWDGSYCLDAGEIQPLNHERYRRFTNFRGATYDILASRGCPYSCSFCCNGLFRRIYAHKGRYVRYRSVDHVIGELEAVVRDFPYVRLINLQDDAFTAAPEEYLEEFADRYARTIGLPIRVRVVPGLFNEARARSLHKARTLVAAMGLQANDRINREVFDRRTRSDQFLATARLLARQGIVGEYHVIIRNPYATEQDETEVCEILSQVPKPYTLLQFPLAFFPNTPLRERAERDGFPVNPRDGYEAAYGSYPERFPDLRAIQEVAPYTPGAWIRAFLRWRHTRAGRWLFAAYYHGVFRVARGLRRVVLGNWTLIAWARALLAGIRNLKASFSATR